MPIPKNLPHRLFLRLIVDLFWTDVFENNK